MSHKKSLKLNPFWRAPKIQDITHPDYRPASEDLPLHPLLWGFNVAAYENDLIEIKKLERNLAKLEPGIHPLQS